jgi:hypothetical protein
MPGRRPPSVDLTDKERCELEGLVRRHTTGQQRADRARIVPRAADGRNTSEIARALALEPDTVRRWRRRWLSDPAHRVVWHSTPQHSSWLNRIELWLSILTRKLLRRGSFASVDDLTARVLACIDHDNRTARPFKWTYKGAILAA